MSNTVISLKKSSIPTAEPISLANGELAINYADGKLFYKNITGNIVSFVSGTNDFAIINANGTLIVSDAIGDILTIEPGNRIEIVGDDINDKITISANTYDTEIIASSSYNKANSANIVATNAYDAANAALAAAVALAIALG